jgi:leucyl aminopeptidase
MSNANIEFHVVPLADRTARSIMLTIFDGIDENREHLVKHLGERTAQMVIELMQEHQVSGKYKEFNLLRGDRDRHGLDWILLMGLGKKKESIFWYRLHDRVRSLVASAARHFRRKYVETFAVDDFSDFGISAEAAGRLITEGALLGLYRFERYKSEPREQTIRSIYVLNSGDSEALKRSLREGAISAGNTLLVRDLVNTPSSDLTPLKFAEEARQVAETTPGLRFEILDKAGMEREKMGLHLAVARGSEADPCVAVVSYCPRGEAAGWDLAMVGKGVTYDSGGYDLKLSGGMYRMYGDMAGAAAVLGAVRTTAQLGLPLNVVGIMPLAENMISGRAYKAGDILKSRKGLSVEITNTDAEGRLLLADSLSYACDRYRPAYLVDIATLTGAIVIALGHFVTGLFTYAKAHPADAELAEKLLSAGHTTGEWTWRMPVDDDYKVQLSSDVADLVNAQTDRSAGAGSITAAVFLKQFIDFDVVKAWAHLDIAGTSLMERTLIYNKCPYWPKEGATGVGVRLLSHFAEQVAREVQPVPA